MKSVGIVMCVLAVVAGMVVARFEHDLEIDAGPPGPSPRAPVPADAGTATGEPPAQAAAAGSARGDRLAPEDATTRLRRVEGLLAEQRFDAAAAAAGDLLRALRGAAGSDLDEVGRSAERLAAKARVFGALIANIDRQGTSLEPREVVLSNGNTIEALTAEKRGDHYYLRLASGIAYRPPLEDVVSVRPLSRERFAAGQWERIRLRLKRLHDPVDLFVRGVVHCYQLGLETQGLEILERLLELEGTDKIPMRFAGRDALAATSDWRTAAGRFPARADRTRVEAGSGLDGRPEDRDSGLGAAHPDEVLAEVRRLRDEAKRLYGRRLDDDRDAAPLSAARTLLERAFSLLEPLPETDEVNELRRHLGQLLSDVVRVSPF